MQYAHAELAQLEGRLRIDDAPFRVFRPNALASVLCFTKPAQRVIDEFSLATETRDGEALAHIFILKHVTRELIDRFVAALQSGP